jgi:uncharacterized protein YdaU (DUF1376 family)
MPKEMSRPYLRLWVADIVQSCQDMTPAQFGAHVRMILHAWDRGYCPADVAKLKRIVGSIDQAELAEVIERWTLTEVDGVAGKVLINNRLEREREYVNAKAAARSEAARKANAVRWAIANGSESDPNRIANGSQTDPIPYSIIQTVPVTETNSENGDSCAASQTRRKRTRRKDTISHSPETGWVGITDADIAAWEEAYPGINVRACIAASHQWILSKPDRAPRSAYRRFLTSWMGRERSGNGSRQGDSPWQQRHESHIPADAHPDDRHLWFMGDGRTPRRIPIYRTSDGRQKWLSGGYADEQEPQPNGDLDAND